MVTYLVTGSNRGIGLEFCKHLKEKGFNVIATCRSSSSELEELNVRVETEIDITSEASTQTLVDKLKGEKIDVLINNAGLLRRESLNQIDPESIREQFEINALSPLRFTSQLLGNLQAGSKIALITSRMGSIEANTSGGSYGFRMSKVALCMAGKSLSIDLNPKEISVAILHPGWVSTRMTGFTSSGITPTESVKGLLERIDLLNLENSGTFWHSNGEVLPW